MTTLNAASDWDGVEFGLAEEALNTLGDYNCKTAFKLLDEFVYQVQEVRRKQLAKEPALLRKEV